VEFRAEVAQECDTTTQPGAWRDHDRSHRPLEPSAMTETILDSHVTEQELIHRAQTAVSNCNWTVGECAAQWTKKFARGRTDADFGELVGMSGDQVYQRRRVFETFADVQTQYASLKWSHFYIALNWEDSTECLSWASDNAATIAEMKAWRRLQRGEDITNDPSDDEAATQWGGDGASAFGEYGSQSATPVRSESDLELPAVRVASSGSDSNRGSREVATADTAGLSQGEYAPYRTGATKPPREVLDEVPGSQPSVSVEQSVKRLSVMIERCAKAITPEVQRNFSQLPEKVRTRFLASLMDLRERTADLK